MSFTIENGIFCLSRLNVLVQFFVFSQVAVRSILLRGFDQQVAEKLGDTMKSLGVKFIRPAVPSKIEKVRSPAKQYLEFVVFLSSTVDPVIFVENCPYFLYFEIVFHRKFSHFVTDVIQVNRL